MRTVCAGMRRRGLVVACVVSVAWASVGIAAAADAPATRPALPAIPAPLNVPQPGPAGTEGPYLPQPILQGGVVVALYPPDSHYLNAKRVREPEQYNMSRATP